MPKRSLFRGALICGAFGLTPALAMASPLKGTWTGVEHKAPEESGFERLEFVGPHRVAGFVYLNHVFAKGGEALESEAHRYKLADNHIRFYSVDGFGAGWPSHEGVDGKTESCRFSFGTTKKRFTLSGCDLAGDWVLSPGK